MTLHGGPNAVTVSQGVFEGIEAARESGEHNMLDRHGVQRWLDEHDYYEAVCWLEEHAEEYSRGIFQGFAVAAELEPLEAE